MPIKMDDTDEKILMMLQEDGKATMREIAEKVGVSTPSAYVRVKKLVENGVIERFTVDVSYDLLGKGFTALVMLRADPKRYAEALERIKAIDDVYEVFDVTGRYSAILKVRTGSREELMEVIDELSLVDGVVSTETAVVLRRVKEDRKIRL